MSTLWYVSRSSGVHDRRWTGLMRSRGHRVVEVPASAGVDDLRELAAQDRPDGVVAGPLTDALPLAVEVGAAPVLGLCWAFDVLLECEDEPTRTRVADALAGTELLHVDCQDLLGRVVGLGFDPLRVSVAAWGIDVDVFTPGPRVEGLRASCGFGPEDVVVLTTRGHQAMYAVDVLLTGFAQAQRTDRRLRLAWAGSGSLDPVLRDLALELGLEGLAVPLGPLDRDALLAWMRSADVYASAALADGSSLTLLEALACGLPAVVTDLPSNREWVTGPDLGRLFPQRDPTGVAGALLEGATLHPAPDARRAPVVERGDWARNQEVFCAAVDRLLAGAT